MPVCGGVNMCVCRWYGMCACSMCICLCLCVVCGVYVHACSVWNICVFIWMVCSCDMCMSCAWICCIVALCNMLCGARVCVMSGVCVYNVLLQCMCVYVHVLCVYYFWCVICLYEGCVWYMFWTCTSKNGINFSPPSTHVPALCKVL